MNVLNKLHNHVKNDRYEEFQDYLRSDEVSGVEAKTWQQCVGSANGWGLLQLLVADASRTRYVDDLLEFFAKFLNKETWCLTDNHKNTLAHIAAAHGNTHAGHLAFIKRHLDASVVEKGSEETEVEWRSRLEKHRRSIWGALDAVGATPLHYAARHHRLQVCEFLLGVSPESATALTEAGDEDRDGDETPLHWAAKQPTTDQQVEVVRLLLASGRQSSKKASTKGYLPLHCAAESGSSGALRELLAVEGAAEGAAKDVPGRGNALCLAINAARWDCARLLLRSAQPPLRTQPIPGATGSTAAKPNVLWVVRPEEPRTTGGLRPYGTPFLGLVRHRPELAMEALDLCVRRQPGTRVNSNRDTEMHPLQLDLRLIEDVWYSGDAASKLLAFDEDGKLMKGAKASAVTTPEHALSRILKEGERRSDDKPQLHHHPVVLAIISHKWRGFGRRFYSILLALFALLVVSQALLVTSASGFAKCTRVKVINGSRCANSSDSVKSLCQKGSMQIVSSWMAFLSILLSLLMLGLEVSQMWTRRAGYLKRWVKNLTELTGLGTALVSAIVWFIYSERLCLASRSAASCFSALVACSFSLRSKRRQVPGEHGWRLRWLWRVPAPLSVLLLGHVFLVQMERLPYVGVYVIMLQTVAVSFMRFLPIPLLSLLIFAIVFHNTIGMIMFRTIPESLGQTLVWMIGEYDFRDTFYPDQGPPPIADFGVTMFIFGVFIATLTIVIMNLMVGLAVDDIASVRKRAAEKRLRLIASFVLEMEQTMLVDRRDTTRGLVTLDEHSSVFNRLLDGLSYVGGMYFSLPNELETTSIREEANRILETRAPHI